MASETTNLHLIKPDPEEAVDIAPINANSDTLDAVYAAMNASISAKASQSDMTAAEERISGLESGLAATANAGAKNQLPDNATTQTINGVTFTANADGSIELSGTATANAVYTIAAGITFSGEEDRFLSGCPDGGGISSYILQLRYDTTQQSVACNNPGGDTLFRADTSQAYRAVIRIASGCTADGLVFRPMIRDAAISDGTYQPYAPTNRELYQMILALRSGSSVQSLTPSDQLTATEPTEEVM